MSIRLIDTDNLQMRMFQGDNVPEYAILSHTWEAGQEVEYEEMEAIEETPNHPARKKEGYQKIIRTCQLAKEASIRYAWVDTCAIDKKSSAELGEAINSMFKWYKRAKECYVWLSDLSASSDFSRDLPKCRWFTRGWTLQELIAPSRVLFYDQKWNCIGTKVQLLKPLAQITDIDESVLQNSDKLKDTPNGRRMSWASRRVTTRVEDTAYCLLGIFDVNIPLLYGEGEKAFLRLQEEICLRSSDLSIFCDSLPAESELRVEQDFGHQRHNIQADSGSEEDIKTLEKPSLPYRDLFARSPLGFVHCGGVIAMEKVKARFQTFSLTNNVLFFRNILMHVARPGMKYDGCYILELGYKKAEDQPQCEMILRKVGASLFARLRHGSLRFRPPRYLSPLRNYPMEQREEAHILAQVPQNLLQNPDLPLEWSISITSKDHDLRYAIREAMPYENWDAPRQRFVTLGSELFQGSIAVFPYFSRTMMENTAGMLNAEGEPHTQPFFYLVCGFKPGTPRQAWVKVFPTPEWDHKRRFFGAWFRDILPQGATEQSSLQIDSLSIKAVAKEIDGPKYNIELQFDLDDASHIKKKFDWKRFMRDR